MTPWDLGQPTPILVHLHQTGTLPKGRSLVPGCGSVSFFIFISTYCCVFQLVFISACFVKPLWGNFIVVLDDLS